MRFELDPLERTSHWINYAIEIADGGVSSITNLRAKHSEKESNFARKPVRHLAHIPRREKSRRDEYARLKCPPSRGEGRGGKEHISVRIY